MGHNHCWHPSPVAHRIDNHADVRCCHCGDDRCVKLERFAPPGHGPHLPAMDYKLRPTEPIPTMSDKPVDS